VTQPERIVDYDSNDYDYREFWVGRDYEAGTEAAVIARCMRRIGRCDWLVDLGSGYGRNYPRYRDHARQVVLVDYSVSNLRTAARLHDADVRAGRLHLIRADVNRLPFLDAAFEVGVIIRVLHHLPDVGRSLPEMLRVLAAQALVDVPIKHHVFARLGAAAHDGYRGVKETATAAPRAVGESEYPFYAFHLDAIRRLLDGLGWDSQIAASVNNFRRWDQILPRAAVTVLNPMMRGLDAVAQRVGRDWWGPNQFLHARRRSVASPPPDGVDLATRLRCPACKGNLTVTADAAGCGPCSRTFDRVDAYWDFTVG
jgi:ubiquinone/menaquinone biosynthesis C-methylase UbiE